MSTEFVSEKYNVDHVEAFCHENAICNFLHPIGLDISTDNFIVHEIEPLSSKDQIPWFKALHYLRWKYHNQELSLSMKNRVKDLINVIRQVLAKSNMKLPRTVSRMLGNKELDQYPINECLLNCIDSFDPWRGYRFSTYAVTSLRRALKRKPSMATSLLLEASPVDYRIESHDINILENEDEYVVLRKVMREELHESELKVIELRYGFNDETPLTLAQVGKLIGVTAEGARKIQLRALSKIKEVMSDCPLHQY